MSSAGSLPSPAVRAFPSHPCVDRYFAAGSIEECRTRLMRCLERGDGPALLIGGPGMGKTMLLGVLAESLAERFQVVSIASTQLCTRRALLQALLFGLGMPYHDREEGELRLALVERLKNAEQCPSGALVLIDEAQALPVRLLEELRILSNAARDGAPLVRLVLAGSPSLEEQFASTELESFNQRLAARCYLSPLSYSDTLQYVRAHVAAAGAEPDELFDDAALESVYAASDGVPRLINQVCDRAIVMAVEQGLSRVDQGLVQAAWSDLHQLPAPWHTPEPTLAEPESQVVEFGVLAASDDDGGALEVMAATDTFASVTLPAPTSPPPTEDGATETPTIAEEADDAPSVPVGVWNADDALDSLEASDQATAQAPVAPSTPEPATECVAKTPDAASLFGEGFEEEELVIDRFASLEAAYSPTTPAVTNRGDDAIAEQLQAFAVHEAALAVDPPPFDKTLTTDAEGGLVIADAPLVGVTKGDATIGDATTDEAATEEDSAAEAPVAESPTHEAEHADVLALPLEKPQAPFELPSSESLSEALPVAELDDAAASADVLIIEQDTITEAGAGAKRQEYRQLFANLRQS